MDRLEVLFQHFSAKAHTFRTGFVCGNFDVNDTTNPEQVGQLHLVREGNVKVIHGNGTVYNISEPSLIFYPRYFSHRFEMDAQMVCAQVTFEGKQANPICAALPDVMHIPLSQLKHSEAVLNLLFAEAESSNDGKQVVINGLMEVLLVQVIRQLISSGEVKLGTLSGLNNDKIKRAISAIHDAPSKEWTVELLAGEAGVSRSVFADLFRQTTGMTPAKYLQNWRITLVKKWLLADQPLKLIAEDAGYKSESSLSRAFKAQCGMSPKQWLAAEKYRDQ
ncbi:helix-turn-helix transcriptional regulator [Salinibius halmophilus]|uniref:helix-turn-helix transcriptional regulator n=1 Tax=Salinibius halmophilus TaxID=1853216 RepID=UPI000E67068E|nr:AraC family transcriptional regulator [Salinibius halmophilus]